MSRILILVISIAVTIVESKIARPRGVSPADASYYQPAEFFTCIASNVQIPFIYVNDNYCDCEDGSDEPGTSACGNRSFYCANRGFLPSYIPSSRVDDGICDCCDGSDENGDIIQCPNTCDELGLKEREARQQNRIMQEAGFRKKQQMISAAQKTKEEKKARVEELQREKDELTKLRDELEVKKAEAEAPEKEAKEKHEKAWEELKAQRQQQREKAAAERAFSELDTNQDQQVEMGELAGNPCFDKDQDGSVSDEEVQEHLEDLERVGLDDFVEKVWPHIKDIYKSPAFREELHRAEEEAHLPAAEAEEAEGEEETPPEPEDEGKKKEEEEKMPDYDEETKKLIEAADAARKAFREAEDRVRNADNEINDLNGYLHLDLGPEDEYGPLKGQCFEFTDREYTYKFCPFDRTSQRPKSGGGETSLGSWGHWDGAVDKYDAQKYERGQNCWNGPDRSAKVVFHCGVTDSLTSASEPNRCEYQFDFNTPAKCVQPSADDLNLNEHDEL